MRLPLPLNTNMGPSDLRSQVASESRNRPGADTFEKPLNVSRIHELTRKQYSAVDISDFHLHDRRQEGTRLLFEEVVEVQQVALVTGHRNCLRLRRYKHFRLENFI